MSRLLPLFPLQLVAFPGSAIPLHIFEERYREMIGRAEAAASEFGIVLSRDGGVVNVGCTATVESVVQRYPDGRFDIVARGQRRFSLLGLDQEEACLRGEVEYFEDSDSAPPALPLRVMALNSWRRIKELRPNDNGEEPDPEHPLFSFQLARSVDDLDFQNAMLRGRSETTRLEQFIDFVREYVPRIVYAERMKQVAPRNGFGHKPAEI